MVYELEWISKMGSNLQNYLGKTDNWYPGLIGTTFGIFMIFTIFMN
jgi:hypothetical protein